ncbi:hypothetical protein SCHPADRAFT_492449 [Schizopora paradoxa]|uniref:Uncharacterized protein n=1 Tax=Schizopora paradoxa TaxID=27342 RepID=A0A0H2RHH7_9AGAM|nr:hypothetical protein SCHPADRAFT_492449 [Schizopora paradoxa]
MCTLHRPISIHHIAVLSRSHLFWGGSKKVAIIMIIWTVGIIIGSCYPFALYNRDVLPVEIHTSHGCIVQPGNSNSIDVEIDFIVLLASETFSLGILLVKSILHRRSLKNVHSDIPKHSILTVMVRFGIGYYFCTIAITIINFVLLKQTSPSLKNFLRSRPSKYTVQSAALSHPLFGRWDLGYINFRRKRLHIRGSIREHFNFSQLPIVPLDVIINEAEIPYKIAMNLNLAARAAQSRQLSSREEPTDFQAHLLVVNQESLRCCYSCD